MPRQFAQSLPNSYLDAALWALVPRRFLLCSASGNVAVYLGIPAWFLYAAVLRAKSHRNRPGHCAASVSSVDSAIVPFICKIAWHICPWTPLAFVELEIARGQFRRGRLGHSTIGSTTDHCFDEGCSHVCPHNTEQPRVQ